MGYTQWSPDMIWFDGASCYGTPSYYVQKMYACNMGDVVLDTRGGERAAAAEEGLYYTASLCEGSGEIILKVVNAREAERSLTLALPEGWRESTRIQAEILTGPGRDAYNTLENPERITPYRKTFRPGEGIVLPALSFAVLRIGK